MQREQVRHGLGWASYSPVHHQMSWGRLFLRTVRHQSKRQLQATHRQANLRETPRSRAPHEHSWSPNQGHSLCWVAARVISGFLTGLLVNRIKLRLCGAKSNCSSLGSKARAVFLPKTNREKKLTTLVCTSFKRQVGTQQCLIRDAEMKSGSVLLPGSAGMKHHLRNSHCRLTCSRQTAPSWIDNSSFQAQYSLFNGRYT